MKVDPEDVIHVCPPKGPLGRLAALRDHPETGAVQLTDDDFSVTTSGERLGCWMGYTLVAGFPADHGVVADEAAMLGLDNWAADSRETPVYHYVVPGDSCTRADDPGYRWHCLSGHGRYLTDWERRPLVAPIAALEARADAMEIELSSKIGSSALDGYVTDSQLTTGLAGKANTTHTHSLSQLTQSGAATGQVATWTGSAWAPADAGGGGGGARGLFSGLMSATVPTTTSTGFNTWVNQGSATLAVDAAGLHITAPSGGSTNIAMLVKTAPATPYTATALLVRTSLAGVNYPMVVFGWRRPATGALQLLTQYGNGSGAMTVSLDNYSSPTSYSGVAAGIGAWGALTHIWVRLSDDGTSVSVAVSASGGAWRTIYTVAKSSGYLGASGYGELCIGASGHGSVTTLTLASYAEG